MFRKIRNLLFKGLNNLVVEGSADIRSPLRALVNVYVARSGKLSIGRDCIIGINTQLGCRKRLEIQDRAMIAQNCFIGDHQHDYKAIGLKRREKFYEKPCIIEQGAWIGFGSVVIGSRIGKDSVVGANSTVINFTVPPGSIFVGDSRLKYKIRKIKPGKGG